MAKIAVIDDSKAILLSVKEYLGGLTEIHLFEDVDLFLDSTRTEHYDLFIVDINMPKKNGLDVINEIKDYPHLKDSKMVIMTAEKSDKYRELAKQLGVKAYIKKPFSKDSLQNAIKKILSSFGEGGGR